MTTTKEFKYRGARAMTFLHEQHLRSCINLWKTAKQKNIKLPVTEDSDYQSLDHLLRHILRAARGYIVWICEKLNLPDPEINEVPEVNTIEAELDRYLEHLLEHWALPLVDIDEERFGEVYQSRWKVVYCIDAMMEHAVMHPIRHEFQLRELLNQKLL